VRAQTGVTATIESNVYLGGLQTLSLRSSARGGQPGGAYRVTGSVSAAWPMATIFAGEMGVKSK